MSEAQTKKQIEELQKKIEYHNNRYYNMDDPEITDYEYDMMMQELKKLEKEHPEYAMPDSPTQKVGGTAKPVSYTHLSRPGDRHRTDHAGGGYPQCN